jgi:HEAT repeat protein
MSMPTKDQRVWILVHTTWDLLDNGLSDSQVISKLNQSGAPSTIAQEALKLAHAEQAKSSHSKSSFQEVLSKVERAVSKEDYETIRSIVAENFHDNRAVYKIYSKLAELLLSPEHSCGTVAAYGLSLLSGYGDWPLIQAMDQNDEMVRYRAAFALGKMGKYGCNGISVLRTALNDPDDWVRDAASEALKAIEKDNSMK